MVNYYTDLALNKRQNEHKIILFKAIDTIEKTSYTIFMINIPQNLRTSLLAMNFSEKEGLTKNGVFCILEDSKGNVWLGSSAAQKIKRGDAFCYDGKSFTNITAKAGLTMVEGFVYEVRSIVEDKVGNIWLGSRDGLLLCYDGKKFINFSEEMSK